MAGSGGQGALVAAIAGAAVIAARHVAMVNRDKTATIGFISNLLRRPPHLWGAPLVPRAGRPGHIGLGKSTPDGGCVIAAA